MRHVIYTTECILPGLKKLVVVIHERLAHRSCFLDSGVSVRVGSVRGAMVYISLHLPHASAQTAADVQSTLQKVCVGLF